MNTSKTYNWNDALNVRHSVRLLCDEEGLDDEQKETLDATVHGESGYNTKATNPNYFVDKLGQKRLASTDFGLCQWNDWYHGKEISPDEALNNPEKAVRLMCSYWKRGLRSQWVAYSSGSYKRYLNLPLPVITPVEAPAMPEVQTKPLEAPQIPTAQIPLTFWQEIFAFFASLFK